MTTAVRATLWSLATGLAVPILLLGAYFVHGSLEDFPTDEQQGKVRIVSGGGILIFTLLEALVVVALLRGRKSNTAPTLLLALTIVAMCSTTAMATVIHHESLESVVQKTTVVLVVDIQSVSEPTKDGIWIRADFVAVPVRVLFGPLPAKPVFSCRYSQGMPHFRGSMAVSPLVTGSGLEFSVKRSDRVVFLLKTDSSGSEDLALLRVEAMDKIDLIQQLIERKRSHRGRPKNKT